MARGRRKKWTPKAHAPPPISEREARLQSRRTRLQVLNLPGAAASPSAFSAPFPLEPTHIHELSSKPHWKSSLEDGFEDVEPAGSSQQASRTTLTRPIHIHRSDCEGCVLLDLSPGSEKKLYEPQIRQRVDYYSSHRWSFRAVTQLRHQHISTKGGVAMGPDGELQWHQYDGLNPMGSIAHLATELVPDLRATASYSWRNPDVNAEGLLLPTVAMARQRYEVMGLEEGVVEEGGQAARQTFKKFWEASSARKYQIDKLRILEKVRHSLFEDEYRAHKSVMVKLRCPTCAAGGLCGTPVAFTQNLIRYLQRGTKDDMMHHMCERGVTKDLRADEFKKLSGAEAWRLVKVHDYGVHRDGLGARALAEVSYPEESVNFQLVPGNKLAWPFSNAKPLAGSKNREIYVSLQVPTETLLKKTWGTNASLVKTFIKDTKKTNQASEPASFSIAKKLAAERYADNDSDEDGPVRHHYFPMLQKWYLFAMPLVQIIQSEPEEVTGWAYSVL
ncbi:BQ5605_C001g00007 [Microbotryum silenes-dioicae]|uniref:BQ5605_C001g00007 protein n=1 Tax=Microbotryum silenes-dioicae TaxID=796604 RepID=A0A2X0M6E5_9BASI|nr:BQ5605_C001g00007 [Microbotryum silenes-dioicae]